MIGYNEILKRLDRHEEEMKKIWESIEKLREDFLIFVKEQEKRWEESNRRWEENNKRWEETYKRFEVIEKVLTEHTEVLKEHGRRIEELSKIISKLEVILGSIGRRWGRDLEKAVFEIFRYVLEERGIEPGRIEKFTYVDIDGKYYRRGAKLEVDIYVHDEKIYLIEVKSYADYEDVEWFYNKASIIGKILGRKVSKLLLIAIHIDEEVLKIAKELGIDVIYSTVIPP